MWSPPFTNEAFKVDPATRSAAAALLCGVLTQRLRAGRAELELCSEILAWAVLPVLFAIATRSKGPCLVDHDEPTLPSITKVKGRGKGKRNGKDIGPGDAQPASAASLWIVALGVATVGLFRAQGGVVEVFQPALTPFLLLAQRQLRLGPELPTSPGSPSLSACFAPFIHTVSGTGLVASLSTIALADWRLWAYAPSAVPAAALLVVYIALTPRIVENAILRLSLRVVPVLVTALCLETIAFGPPRDNTISTIITLGLAKAFYWYFAIQTTRYSSSWRAAAATGTFSITCTLDPFAQSSGVQALSHVMVSLLALAQVVHVLPKQAKAKSALWVFSLLSLVPYLGNIIVTGSAPSPSSLNHSQDHSIQLLIENAKAEFDDLTRRQSTNYTAAHGEYRRRYGVEPPLAFEAWYDYAEQHRSPVIDEFDMIYEAVSPFWRLSGREVIELMHYAQNEPKSDLWRCKFSGRRSETRCSHPHRSFDRNIQHMFNTLLKDLPGTLPNVEFLVNHLDEPRVLTPSSSGREYVYGHDDRLKFTDMSRQPAWDKLTKSCSGEGRERGTREGHAMGEESGLYFVTNRSSDMNLCQHPEYSAMHGFAISPTSFRPVEGLVPILSTGAPSTMSDILYPSPAYMDPEFSYDSTRDVKWDKKWDGLYWAGSNTGGFAWDGRWRHYHRQRFVELAQNLGRRQYDYLRNVGGAITRTSSSFFNGRLFDVGFTRIFQCERTHCRTQRSYFGGSRPWANKDQAFGARLAFDMDGNGISGRYYRLLASGSVPLKQTLFREWHDERLVPWLHYVPVSLGMQELPELVTYLTSTEEGRESAKKIADQGQEWSARALRDVDMGVYMYRLLLELARLQDPGRKAGLAL